MPSLRQLVSRKIVLNKKKQKIQCPLFQKEEEPIININEESDLEEENMVVEEENMVVEEVEEINIESEKTF